MSEELSSGVEKTVINARTVIKGEIFFAGPAVVCGRIEGQIRSEDELEITAEGSVEGDIIGAIVDIQGTVRGNVTASKTTRLGVNAKLIGELRAANLSIAEGATFVGKVCVGEVPVVVKSEPKGATIHARSIEPAAHPVDPAAALQSRLASLQEARQELEETSTYAGEGSRANSGALTSIRRNPVLVKAAH
jgi:cytoskeletal protein CcmA (bactofilin family)